MFSIAIAFVETKYGPASGDAIRITSLALKDPRWPSQVRVVMPLNVAPAPSSARTICEVSSVNSSSPGFTKDLIAS